MLHIHQQYNKNNPWGSLLKLSMVNGREEGDSKLFYLDRLLKSLPCLSFFKVICSFDINTMIILFNYKVLDSLGWLVGSIYYHLFIFLFHSWVQPPMLLFRFLTFLGKWLHSRSSFSQSMNIHELIACRWNFFPISSPSLMYINLLI